MRTPAKRKPIHHSDSLGFKYRSVLKLMTMVNGKTPKGEAAGYLTGILYLHPHTSGGGKTLCPHSTPGCREMCLAGAGLSALPRQQGAKSWRTDLWNQYPEAFMRLLEADIEHLADIAANEGMKPVVRLNGSSDVRWEFELPMLRRGDAHHITFMDYTAYPLHHRRPGPHYHLTYSVKGLEDMERAIGYLRAGQSVTVVVPEDIKHELVGQEVDVGPCAAPFVDGDVHDLRFLDPPGSIVLLKPKGWIRNGLMRPHIVRELAIARKKLAA